MARLPERDRPWVMRTYAGHSSAAASNALFRRNLAKGQTGLSVAFDLPTQTGYDPDHELARGEVGRVGVPVAHLGDCARLFDGLDLGRREHVDDHQRDRDVAARALRHGRAEEQGAADRRSPARRRTTSSRSTCPAGTYIFPPGPSLRLTTDMIAWTVEHCPKWNPVNICSYHLQEAGATPVQEVGFALATARRRARRGARRGPGARRAARRRGRSASRSSSTPGCASSRRWRRCARSPRSGTSSRATRYGVTDPTARRFRYGVQVNSLGLTEAQPENNVQRIVLEMLGVTLSRDARARAVQLPAWNEALGLPRPVGPAVVAAHPAGAGVRVGPAGVPGPLRRLARGRARSSTVHRGRCPGRARPGAGAGRRGGRGRVRLSQERAGRLAGRAARAGWSPATDVVVGVNRFAETEPSPLTAAGAASSSGSTRRSRRRRSAPYATGGPARRRPAVTRGAGPAARRRRRHRQPDAGDAGVRPGRRHHRRVGRRAARGLRRVPGADRAGRRARRRRRAATRRWPRSGSGSGAPARELGAAGCGCWSASRAWTGTPTAPSRSRYAPATPASRWSTRASG